MPVDFVSKGNLACLCLKNVNKGDVIGAVGKTGRSTGAHLDIRLNLFDLKLDPASVLNIN